MTSIQDMDLKMIRSTCRFFTEHPGICATDPMMAATIAEVCSHVNRIEAANSEVVNAPGPALRLQAKEHLEQATDAILELAAVTLRWASTVPDQEELILLMKIPRYLLLRMHEAERTQRLQKMLTAADAVSANIPNNPLSAEAYRNARACMQIHVQDYGAGRNSDSRRTAAVQLLVTLFADCKQLLRHLDLLMRKFQQREPEIWARYKSVRRRVHTGGPVSPTSERAVTIAERRSLKATQAAEMAAEKARIAAEDAANKAKLAAMRKAAAPKKKEKKSKKGRASEGSEPDTGNAA